MKLASLMVMLAAVCVIWYVVTSLLIYSELRRRRMKVSFLWLRGTIPIYAARYRTITRDETGRTGPLFYHWIVSINAALVLILIAILIWGFSG